MRFSHRLHVAYLAAAASLGLSAHAESFTSSASLAGSASSGSVSTSLHSSSSADDKNKTAEGDYRIIQIAAVPEQQAALRLILRSQQSEQEIMLDLPAAVFAKEGLGAGDLIHAQRRVYGYEFAHADDGQPFFLVLADDWHDELAARPLVRL